MQKQGFTLVEIIIVLVLLAVLAMIAVPKYLNLIETAEIQAAKGTLAEVQSRLNMTFYDWLLTGTKVKQNTTENNPNFRKGTAVTTLLPSSCLQAHGGSVANYQYGLADEGTSSCSATGTGTIGGWKVNMQSGEFIHFCEGNKRSYKIQKLTSPTGKVIDFTTNASSGDTIGAQQYADEFILYTPECPAYMSPN
ncbi:MAG: prepilin-type N-terminal cleavage/methylation domain-containing protein [Desulfovibrionaceae bacterium]|nr:prepilin-type N-terminal cleavage/methylation domain-containing protein [Desulfovibrionaceae bacterium]